MYKTINNQPSTLIMQKTLTICLFMISIVGISLYILSFSAAAVDITPSFCSPGDPSYTPEAAACQIDSDQSATENVLVGENGLITRISKALVWVSGALAAILLIISGLMFIFSGGNPESAGRARRTLLYALIGVIVVVSGQAIVTFVLEKL